MKMIEYNDCPPNIGFGEERHSCLTIATLVSFLMLKRLFAIRQFTQSKLCRSR